jgi:N-acetylmuramic acid 6-phosphate etherase
LLKAVEGAEDNAQLGEDDLKALVLKAEDLVVGLAASGRTPYVIGGLKYAMPWAA